ncbi:MAG: outer membrane protein assembly factor BamA [Flavobacteriales bacterium]|nr:outer membrane protein assembly factor BamA [Flavobacteriales bacterium]
MMMIDRICGRAICGVGVLLLTLMFSVQVQGQEIPGIEWGKKYKLAGLTVLGADYTDAQAVKLFSALQIGQELTIPGEELSNSIRNLWAQDLFDDIGIELAEVRGDEVYLVIQVKELPRLTRYSFTGVSRSEQETLKGKVELLTGRVVNENVVATAGKRLREHYHDKGFWDAEIDITQWSDSTFENGARLNIAIKKGEKVKVGEIVLAGTQQIETKRILRTMKDLKAKQWYRIFKSSKFVETNLDAARTQVIALYNTEGFRNARILSDSIYRLDDGSLGIEFDIYEGNQFHFGDIAFTGNAKYRSTQLDSILGIKQGDVYNLERLETRVYMDPKGLDLSSLYQDDGYLTFQVVPIETRIENDTIDIEVRMMEGKQFRIGKVIVKGNTKTNDHVIYREIRTRPGDLFSRTDIIRTQRELAQLNYFNQEAFGINPIQHPEDGTVDIEYAVEEKPSDQIELSGGWGGGRVVGTLGVSFTNFSARNMFKKGAWKPIPTGDGQTLSVRAQSNGLYFQSYNMSFMEPWLGGSKPNNLSLQVWRSIQTNGQPKQIEGVVNDLRQSLEITGLRIGWGQRMKKPDDWFRMDVSLSYQHFVLNDYGVFFSFANGKANNLAMNFAITRNSISDPIFPVWGSNVSISLKATPPYSAFRGKDDQYYADLQDADRYKWVEYHKWKIKAEWYTPLTQSAGENPRSLVLKTHAAIGLIGQYDRRVGLSPFERFYLGGVYLSGYVLDGREIVNLRGFDDLALTMPNQNTGAPVIAKYGAELRYPLSTNPSATIFVLGFVDAGKTWANAREFNPFEVYRSAGVGMRIFLPMFGLLGLDYGWRLDDIPSQPNMARGQFHFSMGMNMGEL